jgi:hypothetical protein
MGVMNACLRLGRMLAALAPWVVASVAVAVSGLALVRRFVPLAVLRENNDVVGNYLQTLSTIFAVLLAAVVYMVWGQFNETRSVVAKEANEVMDLARILRDFPDDLRAPLERALLGYVDRALADEWQALARCDDEPLRRGWELLDEMWANLRGFEPPTEGMTVVFTDARARLNDLGDLRTHRITSSRQRVPAALWILLSIGTVAMVASTYLMGVESFLLHAFMAGSIAGALSHVLYLVWDLDNCFKGYFRVHTTPFLRVREAMLRNAESTSATASDARTAHRTVPLSAR